MMMVLYYHQEFKKLRMDGNPDRACNGWKIYTDSIDSKGFYVVSSINRFGLPEYLGDLLKSYVDKTLYRLAIRSQHL